MTALRAIGRFCYDLVIGDDWKIAAAVLLALVVGAVLAAVTTIPAVALAIVVGVLLLSTFTAAMVIGTRKQ